MIQLDLAQRLLNNGHTPEWVRASSMVKGGKLSPEKRIEIYRHNVMSTLMGALSDLYPVTEKIVSTPFFLRLAENFVRVTPSSSGDLNTFGSEWPDFLRIHTDAINLPYLEDVAKLEWAWHRAFHAKDCPAFDLVKLAKVASDEHTNLQFLLHPSVAFIASAHPIVRIWAVNQTEYAGDMMIDWTLPGDLALVSREDLTVKIQSLPRATFEFLQALDRGNTLGAAADIAFAADTEFDLQHALISAIQSELIIDFKFPASKREDIRINTSARLD
jgi:Putative DNA-binding domain